MASKSNLVNLDAMISREDFSVQSDNELSFDSIQNIAMRDMDMLSGFLRKPDFQRETNHWSPEQVVSLLNSFVTGDLIPSVILWRSSYLFVIDGGHRLSVLRAWKEDDYGDGEISRKYFGEKISEEQLASARRTRELVKETIGEWDSIEAAMKNQNISQQDSQKFSTIYVRALPVQWVKGDSEKAENSFFNINKKGTPLDEVEEKLLRHRKKPISIAARAIIRAGKGHKYWSSFKEENTQKIESLSSNLSQLLFDPNVKSQIKTLNLPLGGSRGVRLALDILINLISIAASKNSEYKKELSNQNIDEDGSDTVDALKSTLKLVNKITGNDKGSLGLHPAVYFYNSTGRHVNPMFLGTAYVISKKIKNNDKNFFKKFITARFYLEEALVERKQIITQLVNRAGHKNRDTFYATLFENLIKIIIKKISESEDKIEDGKIFLTEEEIISASGSEGEVYAARSTSKSNINRRNKNTAFIKKALASSLRCPICRGHLDPEKSISYDHILRKQDGGNGSAENTQITHPYCNHAIKN
ncbi:DUF262 domain-containing protein [Zymobacter sp. IVIA_5232.4 C2]|uniref:GmrSD restriction endonuclease domain-containing protein n=1 Tax=Zymobacter sp. IVIA_5232.4 C2 TaxID=3394855 RepID=UPI0039C306D6